MPGQAPSRSTAKAAPPKPPNKGPSKPAPANLQRTAAAISQAAAKAGQGGSKRR